jgi:hypothetical protein
MFTTDGYDTGMSLDIRDYRSIVWTNEKRSIPSVIISYATPPFCATIIDPEEREILPFQVLGVRFEAKVKCC